MATGRSRNLVIVNPAAGGGSAGDRWPGIRDALSRHTSFEVAFSQYAGHAVELGALAREQGFSQVVCVGGDGTLHEVVNGLFSASPDQPVPMVAVIPCGTGVDFARTVGIPGRIDQACARLASPRFVRCDLGMVFYTGREGRERRYFVNAAGLGYDAEVVNRRNGFNRHVRGTVPYLASLAVTLVTYQNRDIALTVDGVTEKRRVNAVVVAIGSYFGGGMKIAPSAVVDDGYFDVITIGDVGRLELLYNVPRVYRGTHLGNSRVRAERARLVGVESSQQVRIQADGESLGMAPALFQIIPRALTILC